MTNFGGSINESEKLCSYCDNAFLIVNAIILFLFFGPVGYEGEVHFDVTILPMLNAIFNSFTFVSFISSFILYY